MNSLVKKLLLILLVLGVGAALVYGFIAVRTYQGSDYEAAGFFICNPENTECERSEHVHSDIEVTVCGEEINFPKDKGNTNLQHTHKELNKIHWHTREKVDPVTHEPLDKTPRMVRAFLEQMELSLPESCDGTNSSSIVLTVNGSEEPSGLDYVWKDGDKLELVVQ